MPTEMGNISRLQELDLSEFTIQLFHCSVKIFVYCQYCYHMFVDCTTQNFIISSKGYNQLTLLPPEIGNLSNLQKLLYGEHTIVVFFLLVGCCPVPLSHILFLFCKMPMYNCQMRLDYYVILDQLFVGMVPDSMCQWINLFRWPPLLSYYILTLKCAFLKDQIATSVLKPYFHFHIH